MSQIKVSKRATLVISFFLKDKTITKSILNHFENFWGSIDMVSPWIAFNHTLYYEKEMSKPLYRRVVSFKNPIRQFDLAKIKLITNDLEKMYTKSKDRTVNIDPGYILPERFVLATGKNYSHRICIGSGIYADLTLIYKDGDFQVLPWTYPDYAEDCLKDFLVLVRKRTFVNLK